MYLIIYTQSIHNHQKLELSDHQTPFSSKFLLRQTKSQHATNNVFNKLIQPTGWISETLNLKQVKMSTLKCTVLLLATFWRSWRILGRIFKDVQEDRLKLFKCHHRHSEVALQSLNLVSKFLRQTGHVNPLLHFLEKLYQTDMSQKYIKIQQHSRITL